MLGVGLHRLREGEGARHQRAGDDRQVPAAAFAAEAGHERAGDDPRAVGRDPPDVPAQQLEHLVVLRGAHRARGDRDAEQEGSVRAEVGAPHHREPQGVLALQRPHRGGEPSEAVELRRRVGRGAGGRGSVLERAEQLHREHADPVDRPARVGQQHQHPRLDRREQAGGEGLALQRETGHGRPLVELDARAEAQLVAVRVAAQAEREARARPGLQAEGVETLVTSSKIGTSRYRSRTSSSGSCSVEVRAIASL